MNIMNIMNILKKKSNSKIKQLEKLNLMWTVFEKNHKESIRNNKLILKSQQRFRSEKHNVFCEKVNKGLVPKTEEIKCNNIIEKYKNN